MEKNNYTFELKAVNMSENWMISIQNYYFAFIRRADVIN